MLALRCYRWLLPLAYHRRDGIPPKPGTGPASIVAKRSLPDGVSP